jgi:polyisoprenyl-phosphate glycosyltransferase
MSNTSKLNLETVSTSDGKFSRLVILVPLYNDWAAFVRLLEDLEDVLTRESLVAEVVIVDDASSMPYTEALLRVAQRSITSITILRLGRNVGHQRAIAIGIAYVEANRLCDALVVMDSDGEDSAEDVPRLVAASAAGQKSLMFARRAERTEGLVFRVFYQAYRLMYRVLTGVPISFGNFSAVPSTLLPRLVLLSELWNHYPAAVLKARIPMSSVPTRRGKRFAGRSKMTLSSLVLHGLGGISVYGEVIGVRALLASALAMALCFAGIGVVTAIKFLTDLAIPGWATYVVGLLIIILLQTVGLSMMFVFLILNNRNFSGMIPRREYNHYIIAEERVYP